MLRLMLRRDGKQYVLKVCKGCGDEFYALPKQNRCMLCGTGLRRVRRRENDPFNSPDIQAGINRENKKLLDKLPRRVREEVTR